MDIKETLNELLVNLFRSINTIEEQAMRTEEYKDVTTNDMHVIEAIGTGAPKNMTTVARILSVTTGTLTISANSLVKKGYVQRFRCETDKRVVRVGLTKKGRLLYRLHAQFHINVIKKCTDNLDNDEILTLYKALEKLDRFIKGEYFGCSKNDSEK